MSAVVYNEIDKRTAQWLRNLIDAGEIPPGEVDERSICDVEGWGLAATDQFHTFCGIGGWPLALRLAGWPDERPVWTGSCPCQPFSIASPLRKGVEDKRHLWPDFRRLISECRPPTVFGEQVASKAGRDWLDGVRADMEALGYRVGAADLCAAGVGAPHIRQRLYWVAERISDDDEGQQDQGRSGKDRVGEPSGLGGQDDRIHDSAMSRHQPARKREPGEPERGRGLSGLGRPGDDGLRDTASEQNYGERPIDQSGRDIVGRRSKAAPKRARGDDGSYGSSEDDGLRHAQRLGQPGLLRRGPGRVTEDGRPGDGPWWPAQIRRWADGTTRRIEPGLSPLAHGVPGRVGLLRGYGNAIVPTLAAEFVMAYMEASGIDAMNPRRDEGRARG